VVRVGVVVKVDIAFWAHCTRYFSIIMNCIMWLALV